MSFKWHFAIARFDIFSCGSLSHRNATEVKKPPGIPKTFSFHCAYLVPVNYNSINMHTHALCSNKPETRTVCIRSGKRLT